MAAGQASGDGRKGGTKESIFHRGRRSGRARLSKQAISRPSTCPAPQQAGRLVHGPAPGSQAVALQKHGGWQEERHSLQARECLAREGNLHRAPCTVHRPPSRRQVGGGELECKQPSLHPPASSIPAPPPSFSLLPPPLPSRCHLPAQGQNRYLRAPRPSRSPALPRSVRRCLCLCRRLQPHARALQRPRRQLRPLWGPRVTPLTGPASPQFARSSPLLSAPLRRAPM